MSKPDNKSTRTSPSYEDRRNRRSRSRDNYKRISQNNSKRDLKNILVSDSARYRQDHVTPAKRETFYDFGLQMQTRKESKKTSTSKPK